MLFTLKLHSCTDKTKKLIDKEDRANGLLDKANGPLDWEVKLHAVRSPSCFKPFKIFLHGLLH